MFVTTLVIATFVALASAAPYPMPSGTMTCHPCASGGMPSGIASGAAYPVPYGTMDHLCASSGVLPSGVSSGFIASLTPTAYPHTNSTARSTPTPPMHLKPRSTDSICSKPGKLLCSMDGRKVGVCGFAGDEDLQWMAVGEGKWCVCRFGRGCTVTDVE